MSRTSGGAAAARRKAYDVLAALCADRVPPADAVAALLTAAAVLVAQLAPAPRARRSCAEAAAAAWIDQVMEGAE